MISKAVTVPVRLSARVATSASPIATIEAGGASAIGWGTFSLVCLTPLDAARG